jgi:hypothetical protein
VRQIRLTKTAAASVEVVAGTAVQTLGWMSVVAYLAALHSAFAAPIAACVIASKAGLAS